MTLKLFRGVNFIFAKKTDWKQYTVILHHKHYEQYEYRNKDRKPSKNENKKWMIFQGFSWSARYTVFKIKRKNTPLMLVNNHFYHMLCSDNLLIYKDAYVPF